MNRTTAETIALQALSFIASDGETLKSFFAVTGVEPAALRVGTDDPETLAGVLDYLLGDEPRLLGFCDQAGLDPGAPAKARTLLPGGPLAD